MPSGCASPRAQRPAGADRPAWLPHPPTLAIQQRSPRRGWRGPAPDRVRRAHRRGVRWARHTAPAWPCPPAWWVGRSLAQAKAGVTPGGRPEDAPARGVQHPARFGDRQGPQLHLLAEAQRPASVHSADLRLALPGVPHPRPAVLQPRRPAVPGARHRAAGSGVGPVVVGQGTGKRRSAGAGVWPWRWLAGAAAGAAWLAPRGGGSTALGQQAPRRWRRVVPTRSGR
jgi:hypothetical protein